MAAPTLTSDFDGLLILAFRGEPPTLTLCVSTRRLRWRSLATNPALCGIPDGNRVEQVYPFRPLDWHESIANLGNPSKESTSQGSSAAPCTRGPLPHKYAGLLRDRVWFSRRLKSASLLSPYRLLAKPRLLAACLAPHGYLLETAISRCPCIWSSLRFKSSLPACTGSGTTGQ
jgi:hypothetical protein